MSALMKLAGCHPDEIERFESMGETLNGSQEISASEAPTAPDVEDFGSRQGSPGKDLNVYDSGDEGQMSAMSGLYTKMQRMRI